MLKTASFQSFTTVPNGTWKFSNGLNVIIGENGVGKSHILKALYALLKCQAVRSEELSKSVLEKAYAEKLVRVMRPESLGRLVKRKQGRGRCEIRVSMRNSAESSAIGFASNAKSQVDVTDPPQIPIVRSPVYFPTRELITLSPWFVSLYDNYHLEFEETWRDTVSLLGAPSVKGKREEITAQLLKPIEEALGGKVVMDSVSGRFFLQVASEGRMEMPLVAEGLRKFAMLARLISTGVLLDNGYLFWDEPETNLNPKLIKVLARSITHLATHGIQVFIATHSLFLLRELELLAKSPEFKGVKQRYFSLSAAAGGVELEQGDTPDDLQTLVLLDEELRQSDRYMGF